MADTDIEGAGRGSPPGEGAAAATDGATGPRESAATRGASVAGAYAVISTVACHTGGERFRIVPPDDIGYGGAVHDSIAGGFRRAFARSGACCGCFILSHGRPQRTHCPAGGQAGQDPRRHGERAGYADKAGLIRAVLHRIEEQDVALLAVDASLPRRRRFASCSAASRNPGS
jgi:hypothetical protein